MYMKPRSYLPSPDAPHYAISQPLVTRQRKSKRLIHIPVENQIIYKRKWYKFSLSFSGSHSPLTVSPLNLSLSHSHTLILKLLN
ncbi:hypothetical protein RJT34_32319 [Clitoria ternatea]|uniref:Uncharacterized protein n=1 Tax=Clitoria ternatea TaxID=43366 RepID=A0AAN9EX75_CLITE